MNEKLDKEEIKIEYEYVDVPLPKPMVDFIEKVIQYGYLGLDSVDEFVRESVRRNILRYTDE